MDWDRFQRDAWIEHADIPKGVAKDGKTVTPNKMKGLLMLLNSHMGENSECWPSQDLLAKKMSVSVKTVQRAAEALQNLSLLIVQSKNRPGRQNVQNHYRIVWSELLLLDEDRRRAFNESIAGSRAEVRTERSDTVAERSDIVSQRSDTGAERSDIVSAELTTNYSKNKSKNQPLPSSEEQASGTNPTSGTNLTPSHRMVVVGLLTSLGMSGGGSELAADAAIARGATLEEVNELIAVFHRKRGTNPKFKLGFLFNWIRGTHSPPVDPSPEPASVNRSTVTRAERRKQFESGVRYRASKAGLTEPQIERAVADKLRQYDIDEGLAPRPGGDSDSDPELAALAEVFASAKPQTSSSQGLQKL